MMQETSSSSRKFCWVLNARQATVAFTIFNQILLLLMFSILGLAWYATDITTSEEPNEHTIAVELGIKAGIIIVLVKFSIGTLVLAGAVMRLRWCLLPYMILTPISLGWTLFNTLEGPSIPMKNAASLFMLIAFLGIIFGLALFTLVVTTTLYFELRRDSRRHTHALPCNLKQYIAQTQHNKYGPAYVTIPEPTIVSTGSH